MMNGLPMFVGADITAINGARCYNPNPDNARLGPDAWSPDGKTDMDPGRTGWEAARECRTCPARLECLTQALDRDETHGIWGGFWFGDADDKARAQRSLKLRRKSTPSSVGGCVDGSYAGYQAHRRRGENPCEPCRKAKNVYQSGQRKRGAA